MSRAQQKGRGKIRALLAESSGRSKTDQRAFFLLRAVALGALALKLAGAANGSSLFASAHFRRLFKVTAQLHLAVHALTLQLLLERAKGLVDIVVANENLHKPLHLNADGESPQGAGITLNGRNR
jgi:hypothetical protein